MQCDIARRIMADSWTGTLTPEEETQLEEHLSGCSGCRKESSDLRALWKDLAVVASRELDCTTGRGRLEATIAAYRQENLPPLTVFQMIRSWTMRHPIQAAAIAVFTLGLAGGAVMMSRQTQTVSVKNDFPAPPTSNQTEGHIRGNVSAAVTLTEYGDYECPPCATINPMVVELLKKYPEMLKLEYRHLPLSKVHPNAFAAAKAAEAAGEQGRYWEMNDLLFARQRTWAKSHDAKMEFLGMARELGLDQTRFTRDFESSAIESRVLDAAARAEAASIVGTPTFLVDGQVMSGTPQTVEELEDLIKALHHRPRK